MNIKIYEEDGKIVLDTPYHPDVPVKAKLIGGEYNSQSKTWHFHKSTEERVRNLARETFGTDGEEKVDLVTVRINMSYNRETSGSSFWSLGRLIAERKGRDASVRLGQDVIVIEGKFSPSAGSSKHPSLMGYHDHVILEVIDVPAPLAYSAVEKDSEVYSLMSEPEIVSPMSRFSTTEIIQELNARGFSLPDSFYDMYADIIKGE